MQKKTSMNKVIIILFLVLKILSYSFEVKIMDLLWKLLFLKSKNKNYDWDKLGTEFNWDLDLDSEYKFTKNKK